MSTIVNRALARMRAGEPALGIILRISRSGDLGYIAAACDHDFLFIDLQHGGHSVETAVDISLAALGAGVAPLVRLGGADNPEAPRLLDSGVMGIIVPGVGSADEARRAVANCKFPPVGTRSVGAGYPQLGYRPMPVDQATALLNDNTLLCCMIETKEGLDSLEEIAAVPGVDVLHLGANDLLTAVGLPGQFGHGFIDEVTDRLIRACESNGKFAGLGGDKDIDRQGAFLRRGGRFVTTHSDLAYLMAGATERARRLRAAQ